MVKITGFEVHGKCLESTNHMCAPHLVVLDVRFPTSLTGDGTDAMYFITSYAQVTPINVNAQEHRV